MRVILAGLTVLNFWAVRADEVVVVERSLCHVRNGEPREWETFPEQPDAAALERTFSVSGIQNDSTLRMLQQDVKQSWKIRLNGHDVGQLHRDENSIIGYWPVPAETLHDGENTLTVSTDSHEVDDIRIGEVELIAGSMKDVLAQSTIKVEVRDEHSGLATPCRVTVLQSDSLATTGAVSDDEMAVRPGVIYCRGRAVLPVRPGIYTIVAGRGPEFSIHRKTVTVAAGENASVTLTIRREVPTDGLVACDTHVHTFTHSRHGDSTVRERMLTLAGECVELPIATDHNIHVDYRSTARDMNLQKYFTPVIGNEVTTKLGHFNVFPIASAETPIPDYKAEAWPKIFDSIFSTADVRVAILNHARDVHSGFRPFAPEHFLAATGTNPDGWELKANAMEVVNSAAQQSDMMAMVRDWMSLMNAGKILTPVGCSDSHDVARHFVAQGRTYIQCDDYDVSSIDISKAVDSFLQGRVTVSCGLIVTVTVNQTFRPGDLVPLAANYDCEVHVLGPSWISATEVDVFMNGELVSTHKVPQDQGRIGGTKLVVTTQLPVSDHQDVFVTAVARGPGVTELYWPIAKPYQPSSASWTPMCMAVSGAIRIDGDGDGHFTAAREYARQLVHQHGADVQKTVDELSRFDVAVAVHTAELLHAGDSERFLSAVLPVARRASGDVRLAFESFLESWQISQRARLQGKSP